MSVDEAVAFFRARGCLVRGVKNLETRLFFVWPGKDERGPCFLVSEEGKSWNVGDTAGAPMSFGSLADAVNAILARLQAWLAANPN
jgi:hypothetical protein